MKTLLFLVAALVSVQANAGIFDSDVRDLDLPCKVFDTDYYVGFGLGRSRPHALYYTSTAKYFGSGNLFVGKRLSQTFALEASYISLGSFFNQSTNQTTVLDTFAFSLLGKYPLDEARYVSLYGRGGYAATVINLVPVGKVWHGDVTYGLGVEFTLSPAEQRVWYLRAGVDRYNTGSFTPIYQGGYVPRDYVMNYSVSLLFNF